ncbi:MAG: DoxX family protein [Bacteroidota bacterium]
MNIATWIIQVLLGVMFLLAGAMKTFTPIDEMAMNEGMAWAAAVPTWMPKLAGIAEILGGLGMILPSALRIRPELTVYAGYGLTLVMIFAVILHISRGEPFVSPLVLGALAAFVSWSRSKKVPIAAK